MHSHTAVLLLFFPNTNLLHPKLLFQSKTPVEAAPESGPALPARRGPNKLQVCTEVHSVRAAADRVRLLPYLSNMPYFIAQFHRKTPQKIATTAEAARDMSAVPSLRHVQRRVHELHAVCGGVCESLALQYWPTRHIYYSPRLLRLIFFGFSAAAGVSPRPSAAASTESPATTKSWTTPLLMSTMNPCRAALSAPTATRSSRSCERTCRPSPAPSTRLSFY